MGIPPAGGRNERGQIAGGEELRLPPPEHSHIVYCKQAYYGTVYGGRAQARVKDGQAVVVAGRIGFGGDVDGRLGGGTDRGGGGDGQDGYGD